MTYEEQLVADRPTIEEWNQSMREEIARKKVTLQDVLVLGKLVREALPHLPFGAPGWPITDQEVVGSELLRLVNHVGALYEYTKEAK